MHLSVIIPAFNESKRIVETLHYIDTYLKKQDYDYEIILVDDGSADDTVEVVRNLKIKNLRIIENEENRGKGVVVKQGMLEAKGELRLFMDADNSTTIDQIEALLPHLDKGYDVVIGSRRVYGAQIEIHQSWIKEFLGKLGNLWIRFWAVSGINDTQAGFKLFTAKSANTIFERITIDRWGLDFEALAIARKHKFKIKEAPIKWSNDERSNVTTGGYIKTLLEAVKVWWNLLTGKYK
ncbi:MAG: dolichyl-phosphate beta-glucosyltransferase [Parcubacteria group bacterium]